jgi:hypothetical protein
MAGATLLPPQIFTTFIAAFVAAFNLTFVTSVVTSVVPSVRVLRMSDRRKPK